MIGYELDVEAIQKKLEDEKDKKGYEDYTKDSSKSSGVES